MSPLQHPFVYAVVGLIVFLLRRLYRDYQFKQFAARNGCQPAPHSAAKWPFAFDRMWGMIKLLQRHGDLLEEIIMPQFVKYGSTFSTAALKNTTFITAAPENFKALLSTNFAQSAIGDTRYHAFGDMVGRCIFTTDGEPWKQSRGLFKRQFSRSELNDLASKEDNIRDLIQAVEQHSREGDRWTAEFDLQPLFQNFMMDVGTKFFFGVDIKSQLAAIPGALNNKNQITVKAEKAAAKSARADITFSHAFEVSNSYCTKRSRLGPLAWLVKSDEGKQGSRYMRAYVGSLVDAQLRRGSNEKAAEEGKYSLVKGLSEEVQDPIKIRDEAILALLASRDTTSKLLDWTFLMMAKYPAKFAKLREHILKDLEEGDEEVTFYGLKKCQYLQWFINETLRLRPSAPINGRVANQNMILPVGGGPDGKSPVAVGKGQIVLMVMYAMHRRTDIWGDDALEFKPERWENKKQTDWSFLPFSGGPRACPGKEYALAQAGLVIVRLLQNYDNIEAVDDLTTIPQYVTSVMEAPGGVNVRLRKAEGRD